MGGTRGTRVAWEGEMWRLRHITFPQCIKGTGLSVTHTVRMGRGGWKGEREREKEGQREEDDEEEREEERVFFPLPLYFFLQFLSFFQPSISDVIQVTYSSHGGNLPPLPLFSSHVISVSPPSLPPSLPPSSLFAQLTG